jgi:serine/threonine protein kinase
VRILLNSIKYLHDKNIVHRDLKPENLLMTSKEDDASVKLADFGFAVIADGFSITNQCGTPGYIAPEILENKAYGKSNISSSISFTSLIIYTIGKPVDMWSFGVILYILLGGYPPFHDDNQRALFRKIIKGEYQFHPDYWNTVSEDAKDLIRGLLTVDMKKRLTVDQALAHPWLKTADSELAARNLDSNLAELRKYQATRKLRAGVKAVIAINRMKNLIGGIKEAAELCAAEDEAPAEQARDATRA